MVRSTGGRFGAKGVKRGAAKRDRAGAVNESESNKKGGKVVNTRNNYKIKPR